MLRILLMVFIIGLSLPFYAENFSIKNYFIDMEIKKNSSIHIIEDILVQYDEPSSGIECKIPFQLDYQSGFMFQRMVPVFFSKKYQIIITDVNVKGDYYQVKKTADSILIDIGNKTHKSEGQKHYILSYNIYGIIDKSEDGYLLVWDLIHNGWTTLIENVDCHIQFPQELTSAISYSFSTQSYMDQTGFRMESQVQGKSIFSRTVTSVLPGQSIGFKAVITPSNYFVLDPILFLKLFAINNLYWIIGLLIVLMVMSIVFLIKIKLN